MIDDFRSFLTDILFKGNDAPGGFKAQQLMDYFKDPEMANKLSQQEVTSAFNTNAPSTRYSVFLNNLVGGNQDQKLTPEQLEPEVRKPAPDPEPPPKRLNPSFVNIVNDTGNIFSQGAAPYGGLWDTFWGNHYNRWKGDPESLNGLLTAPWVEQTIRDRYNESDSKRRDIRGGWTNSALDAIGRLKRFSEPHWI